MTCLIRSVICMCFLFLFQNALFGRGREYREGTIIDLNACHFVIEEFKLVDEIKAGKKKIRKHDRGYQLAIVKLHGRSPADGPFVQHPAIFSFIYEKNGRSVCVPSKALGYESVTESGEVKKHWVKHEKGSLITVTMDLKKDEEIVLYIAFDLPNGVSTFHLMIPSITHTHYINNKPL